MKSKAQKEQERLEREALWAAEDAALKAQAGYREPEPESPPLYCQACDARLKSSATRCHYCGSQDLAPDRVSLPLFSKVALVVNGVATCPTCKGTTFKNPGMAGPAVAGLLVAGVLGAAVGAAASSDDIVLCTTCGARFKKG